MPRQRAGRRRRPRLHRRRPKRERACRGRRGTGPGLPWREGGEGAGPTCQLGAESPVAALEGQRWRAANGAVTEVTARPYKGCNIKTGSKKEVSTLQGHGRKRDLFQGLAGNFLILMR